MECSSEVKLHPQISFTFLHSIRHYLSNLLDCQSFAAVLSGRNYKTRKWLYLQKHLFFINVVNVIDLYSILFFTNFIQKIKFGTEISVFICPMLSIWTLKFYRGRDMKLWNYNNQQFRRHRRGGGVNTLKNL